jgi:hypothetical protein
MAFDLGSLAGGAWTGVLTAVRPTCDGWMAPRFDGVPAGRTYERAYGDMCGLGLRGA